MKLQYKILTYMTIIIFLTLGISSYFGVEYLQRKMKLQIGQSAMNTAVAVASMPQIQDNLGDIKGSDKIQGIIERIRLSSNIQFITVIDMNSTRFSHPVPERIGEKFEGNDEKRAIYTGESYITEGKGTLGISLRAFTPVYKDGVQVGVVCAGILIDNVRTELREFLRGLVPFIAIGLIIGLIGAALLSYNIKKSIFGLEPEEIAWILSEREAILENVKEGIMAVDEQGKIILINKSARKILNLSTETLGKDINKFKMGNFFDKVIKNKELLSNVEEKTENGINILSNYMPLINSKGNFEGALVSFQDMTEVKKMAEELTGIKKLTWDLRAQNHEFMNKLHTISGLIQLEEYKRALSYIQEISRIRTNVVGILNNNIKDVALSAMLLAKYNKASEARIDFEIDNSSYISESHKCLTSDDLMCIAGNLIENSIDAVIGMNKGKIYFYIREDKVNITMKVRNNGAAISKEIIKKVFELGVSTKQGNRGYGLYNVKRILDEAGGTIEVTSEEETEWVVEVPVVK